MPQLKNSYWEEKVEKIVEKTEETILRADKGNFPSNRIRT